ncbi:hypothetical protein [Rathayibacter soli]|uniref:hypothetical protein n=1 Tax=Rathayibacter soli TaxID=3144168 RepID=UPI0027E3FB5E|nr:hypothetical protein [Glaciibacter superstes]
MNIREVARENLNRSGAPTTLGWLLTLAWGYVAVSVVTFVAIVLTRGDTSVVNTAVWIRGTIVAATSVLLLIYALQARSGSPRGLLRTRIVSAIVLVAIVAILVIPLPFPRWMRLEQALCGLILFGIVILANRKSLRSAFRALEAASAQ